MGRRGGHLRWSVPNRNPNPPPREKIAARTHADKLSQIGQLDTHLIVYTDGSLSEVNGQRVAGAAFVIKHRGRTVKESSTNLGNKAEVFDAEVHALAGAAIHAWVLVKTTL